MVPDTVAPFNLRRNYAKAVDDLFALACCLTNYLAHFFSDYLAHDRTGCEWLPAADGILMANSLHFIRDQQMLLRKLAPLTGCFLIVEYERSKPSPWVPFPVGFLNLCELFRATGVERIEQMATLRSRFGGTMYSAFATRP
jgi:hypothetical protein